MNIKYVIQKNGEKVLLSDAMHIESESGDAFIDLRVVTNKKLVLVKAEEWVMNFIEVADGCRDSAHAVEVYLHTLAEQHKDFELEEDEVLFNSIKEQLREWERDDENFIYDEMDFNELFGVKSILL
jgi:hypothetical protein